MLRLSLGSRPPPLPTDSPLFTSPSLAVDSPPHVVIVAFLLTAKGDATPRFTGLAAARCLILRAVFAVGTGEEGKTTMPDATTPLADLKEAVRCFAQERDWERFHNPKNLSMGLATEAAELMEHFLWVEGEVSRNVVHDAAKLGEVAEEMADVACYLLNLSLTLGIDLSEAIVAKIAKNGLKYPAEKYRGRYQLEA